MLRPAIPVAAGSTIPPTPENDAMFAASSRGQCGDTVETQTIIGRLTKTSSPKLRRACLRRDPPASRKNDQISPESFGFTARLMVRHKTPSHSYRPREKHQTAMTQRLT